MKITYLHLHLLLAVAWMSFALAFGIRTALLGNEAAVLGKQRGADLKVRTDIAIKNERLRTAIDWEASAPMLGEAVRRLELPLYPASMARADR